jgi:hypothetical protein
MPKEPSFEAIIHEAPVMPFQSLADHRYRALSEPPGSDPLLTQPQNARHDSCLAAQLHTHLSLMHNELLREALMHITTATAHAAKLLTEQGQPPVGISHSVEAHEATAPARTLAVWRLFAPDLATVNALTHRYQEPRGCLDAPPRRLVLYQHRLMPRCHHHRIANVLTRIESFARPQINDPERT